MKIGNTTLLTLIIMIIIPSFLVAQESQLTLDQLNEFFRKKLIVELDETTETDTPYSESKRWKAYQGEKMISERQFYLIAGHPYKAKRVREQKAVSLLELIGSPLVFLIGGVILKHFAEKPPETDEGSEAVASLVLGTVGIGGYLFVDGIKGLATKSTSYSIAEEVKNEYNEQLLREIMEKD
jgi:hypothetical protein